jgi:hypothetical protein
LTSAKGKSGRRKAKDALLSLEERESMGGKKIRKERRETRRDEIATSFFCTKHFCIMLHLFCETCLVPILPIAPCIGSI